METKAYSVLVLDGDMVSSLTIARSLHKKGIKIDLAGHDPCALVGYSRCIHKYHLCPDPLADAEAFLLWLQAILYRSSYDLIIPVTERTLVPISRHRERFVSYRIAMADDYGLELVLDKSRTFSLARELGLSVPVSLTVTSMSELAGVEEELGYPVVVKPARSVAESSQGSAQLKVEYAFNNQELVAKVGHVLAFGEVILQQYVRGDGVGIEILAAEGEILYAFGHLRLHEVPLTGGGSSLRMSIPLDQELLEASRRLIKALRWQGVAMIEFKRDPSLGTYHLMEINGRFWGSLPLASAAGADFPGMLFDLLVTGQRTFLQSYKEGIYCRRLTSDVHWYELALRKAAPAQLDVVPSGRRMLKDLLLILSLKHRFDVQSLRDPLPSLVEFGQLASSYYQRFICILRERWRYRYHARAWQNGSVAAALVNARQVLFVCYGNINRSAVAEVFSRKVIENQSVKVVSAGFHKHGGREADPVMQTVAGAAGVSFAGFASSTLEIEQVCQSDAIFVMELKHYDELIGKYPWARDVTFLLGGADGSQGSTMTIDDPYGLPKSAYEKCFSKVCSCVSEVLRLTGGRREQNL